MRNKIYTPHYITLIFFATILVALTSWIGSIYEWPVQNILSPEGIRWTLRHIDENFYQAPLSSIFILFIGLGLAHASGLFDILQRPIQRMGLHKPLSRKIKRALLLSLISGVIYLALVTIATFSPLAILLGVTGTLDRSPFMEGIIPLTSIAFCIIGMVFGIASGQFRNDKDIIKGMGSLLTRTINYFIFIFIASQFLGLLHFSLLDKCIGIGEKGTMVLHTLLYYLPLLDVFIPKKK